MVKKNFFWTAILIIALLVLGGCFSTPAAKETAYYHQDKDIYPAIYGAFTELYPNAKFLDIDFYNNKYTLTGITGYALTTPVSYDMLVTLSDTGEIDIKYADIWMRDSNGRWGRSNAFGFYDFNSAASAVSAKMIEIANDPSLYEKYQRASMADIKFVYTIMKNFTGLAFRDFIDNYAKGSVFNISGPISNVREVNREINGNTYKYSVTLSQSLKEDNSSYFFSSLLSDYVYCIFYTNRDDVIRLSRTATLSVRGILTGASQGSIGTSVSMELVDAN